MKHALTAPTADHYLCGSPRGPGGTWGEPCPTCVARTPMAVLAAMDLGVGGGPSTLTACFICATPNAGLMGSYGDLCDKCYWRSEGDQ